ncbi:uncharacterized protein LOC142214486 [Leptodactylus fuscus]|uniref:uncharacterized protein LOC142214486 n=1 Tax=Leptodactylus fuscus TaxID=238119 RepID=UPI003F4EAC8D
MAGPFSSTPFEDLVVSPLGVVPKKEPFKFRLIHHLSHPHGSSVNDGIDAELCAVQYTSFDTAVSWWVAGKFGVPLAPEKTEGPSTCLSFLGIMIDTVLMEFCLPNEKLEDLKGIRLALINKEYIPGNVITNKYVKDNEDCKAFINTALTLGPNMVRPRLPCAILLAFGGCNEAELTKTLRSYDTRANQWTSITSAEEKPRAYHGTAYLNGHIYFIGGFDGVDNLRSVKCFDPVKKTWHEAAFMNYKRGYVSVTVLNNYIYAMGGFDGQETLKTVERYDSDANRWILISSMHEKRKDAGATTLDGKIYICGGSNGQDCLSTAEIYNPGCKQWSYISPMKSRRSGVGVTAYRREVFAISGSDGQNCLQTVEVYSPITKTWCRAPNIPKQRRNFGTGVIDDHLYIVGGRNSFSTTFTDEYYDEKTKAWCHAHTNDISPSRKPEVPCPAEEDADNSRTMLRSFWPASQDQEVRDLATQNEEGQQPLHSAGEDPALLLTSTDKASSDKPLQRLPDIGRRIKICFKLGVINGLFQTGAIAWRKC